MYCALCQSRKQAEFTVEMMIHFGGPKNIDDPGILAFPKVSVCLECGFAAFTVPETELRLLKAGITPSTAS